MLLNQPMPKQGRPNAFFRLLCRKASAMFSVSEDVGIRRNAAASESSDEQLTVLGTDDSVIFTLEQKNRRTPLGDVLFS
jgi:hypothetical protein